MPFDGNGNASLNPGYFVQNGETIVPSQHNPPFEDIVAMLNQVLLRNGAAPLSGNLNANGNKVTGLAEPTNPNDAARLADIPSGEAEVFYEETGLTIPNGGSIIVSDFPENTRYLQIEAAISGVSSAGTGRNFIVDVGDDATFDTSSFNLTSWAGDTGARNVFANIYNLTDNALAVIFQSIAQGTAGALPVTTYSARPISRLRFRLGIIGGTASLSITKMKITAIF